MFLTAGLLLVAGQILDASTLTALGESDDARAVPHLEDTLGKSVDELKRFPPALPPPDLENEIVAALMALERLDQESALVRARAILRAPVSERLSLVARRVAARAGDHDVVHTALDEYFHDRVASRLVLGDAAAASDDIRLRDFLDFAELPDPPTHELFVTRLSHFLGGKMVPPSVRLFDDLLASDTLETERRVLALPLHERYRALRFLAARDHPSLMGLPLDSVTIDRLYPYLALSQHQTLRERVRRARSARGRALASLLLTPHIDDAERRAHADAMRDAWSDAIIVVGRDLLSPVVGKERMVRFIADSNLSEAFVHIDVAEARERLENEGTPRALRWLGMRSDTVRSLPTLTTLRDAAEETVRVAAAIELLRLGAHGFIDPEFVQRFVRRLGETDGRDPDALVAMLQFHELHPRRFLRWLEASDDSLRERAHFVMALSGDASRLPLLVELAVTGGGVSRDAAFRGLFEVDLGGFDKRLHRLAGDPERDVRFQTAVALVPVGEAWALRLLIAELDDTSPYERLRARRALERLPMDDAIELLETLVSDGTATPFAIELYLIYRALEAGRELGSSRERVWQMLAPHVASGDPTALLAAARLGYREARSAVGRYLER